MPRVALIQDGTEVARQRFADVRETFDRCRRILNEDGYSSFTFQVFTDEEAGFLLDGIDRKEWACVVFASNALRSEEVANAVEHRREDLQAYVKSGGGVVVLHQIADSLSPVLPDDLAPTLAPRLTPAGEGRATLPDGRRDLLLSFPAFVAWESLRDLAPDELAALRAQAHVSELARQYFVAMRPETLPAKYQPVLVSSGDVVVARTTDAADERVVIATMPLDWQGRRPGQDGATTALLANAIRYTALGSPTRLVWRDESSTTNELLRRWLCLDGGTAMRVGPRGADPMADVDEWLLSSVDALFLPPSELEQAVERPPVRRFLDFGGTVLTTGRDPVASWTRVTAVVGRYEHRELSTRLFAELRAGAGWRTPESAFRLRNILSALAFLAGDDVARANPMAVDPASLTELVEPVRSRLLDPNHQEDFGSSMALAQSLAILRGRVPVSPDVVGWIAGEGPNREFDVALQASATLAFAYHQPHATFLADAAATLSTHAGGLPSPAPLVRILDAVAYLHQSGLLGPDEDAAVMLAAVAVDVLARFPAHGERGWISVEATADIVRGLVALDACVPAGAPVAAALAGHVATGASALRLARRRYEGGAKDVAWLARITHALIVAERRFPLGLQRLTSLDWPDVPGDRSVVRTTHALVERLSIENERVRLAEAKLSEDLATQTAALARSARPAQVGRAAATLVPTVVLLVAAWSVVRAIGWSTLPGLLANVTVLLSIILALLAGAFGLLDRWNLLAGPAVKFRLWVEKNASPLVSSFAKLKRG